MYCGTCSEETGEVIELLSKISGLHYSYSYTVTPTTQQAIAYDEESWKSKLEEDLKEQPFVRSTEVRESRTKKVKKYLKKCKNVLGRSNSTDQSTGESSSVSSWYVDEDPLAIITNTSEINEINEDYEEAQVSLDLGKCSGVYQTAVANVILVKKPEGVEECLDVREEEKNATSKEEDSSPPLQNVQGREDELQKKLKEHEVDEDCPMMKTDVASLVDKYFGELYENYYNSRNCLVRQARDLLVCQYHGCLQTFENEFCIQAAKLLQYLKVQSSGPNSLLGWPLCIGQSGIVIHLSPLDPSAVRNSDCYLCLTSRPPKGLEVTLTWRQNLGIQHHTIAHFNNSTESIDAIMCSNIRSVSDLEMHSYDDYDGSELPGLLQNLLVSVERAIERVPLDDLTFPCPQCLQYLPLDREDETSTCACQCSCKPLSMVLNNACKKDTSIQTSPMLEFAASIPHIDSDTEDDKESIKSGIIRLEVVRPKIVDLPEKLLMCGINLPGTFDVDGRPIIVCNALTISKAGLNKYEIAKLLLYYSTIPPAKTVDRGFTVLLIASNELDLKILQLFDKSTSLIENYVRVCNYLIWRPGIKTTEEKCNINHISTITITNKSTLEKYVSKNQMPIVCGGTSNHNQQEWVEFHRILEPFFESCKSTGQSLLATLSRLRNEEIPTPVTRKFLNHQCRQISKTLQMECLKKIRSEGRSVLSSLEKSKAVGTNADVKRSLDFAEESFNAVDKVAKRLEQLEKERRKRLKELIKFRATDSEITELTNWTETEAELTLNKLILTLRCAENAKEVRDISHDFEQFFFSAWKKVEKSSDLNEECKNITDTKCDSVKKSCENLKEKMKIFREKLEETRIQIENSSRCFLLLESCNDILEDDNKEQEGFVELGMNSGNNKLEELCKSVEGQTRTKTPTQPPDKENPDPGKYMITSTPIKPNAQIRRRSISSHAYIYHCSHHAAGEVCNCEESDNESTSLSYKLKKKYLQLQTCCSNNVTKDFLERKNSATLGGIKEESTENLLDKTDFKHNECKRCDSGVSTGDEGNFNKSKLQRNCSCHCCRQSCIMCSAASSSSDSTPDQTEKDSILEEDTHEFGKSSDDTEEDFTEEKRTVLPISANNHLYWHASNLDLPSDALYINMDPKTQKTLKFIIREMIETERDYVKSLDYVIVNFIPEISREDIPQALRGQRNTVFGNVEKIYEFHSQHFLLELEECENNPLQVGQIFLNHDKKFYLYALYNKNKPKSDTLMSEYGTFFFKSKQIELGDKMDLASYLLKPVQRMGKYALLLQQLMKACPTPEDERPPPEFEDLKSAEEMVRFQLRHGNDLLAMDSIRECDVNLKEQGRLLRQNEFLVWEGRTGKKSLRQVFLFEELILFSKAKRFPDNKNLDLYYYKNSIKMTDIGLTPKISDSSTKFEIWFRKMKPNDTFTLQSMSLEVKKAWTEELSQLLWKQAIRNRAARLQEMSSMGIGNKPCLDIKPSVDQISHRSISFAQLNKSAPRFRNSIAGPAPETCRNVKRPHSVISMSSMSSGSSSSGASGSAHNGLGHSTSCESTCESPKPYHRSATLNSQCSMESGILADMSVVSDDL